MTEVMISPLIKIILGMIVLVIVVSGIYLFFKYNVIDFFKGISGGEDEEEFGGAGASGGFEFGEKTKIGELESEPLRFCEDCKKNRLDVFCSEKECSEIDLELREFSKRCQFIQNKKINPFDNKCITLIV